MPCFVCRACPASPLSRSLICCDRTGLEVLQTPALLLLRDRRIEPGELPTDWICQKYPKMTKWIKDYHMTYHMLKIWISSKAFCSPFFVTALLVLNSPRREVYSVESVLCLFLLDVSHPWSWKSIWKKNTNSHEMLFYVFFTPLCLHFVSSFLAFTRPLLCQGGTQLLLEVIQLLLFLMWKM